MIEADKVNLILDALRLGQERLHARGTARVTTSEAVCFIVAEAVTVLDGKATREEVLEAWVYQLVSERMHRAGVQPMPPRAS